jgi:hypothetical protein
MAAQRHSQPEYAIESGTLGVRNQRVESTLFAFFGAERAQWRSRDVGGPSNRHRARDSTLPAYFVKFVHSYTETRYPCSQIIEFRFFSHSRASDTLAKRFHAKRAGESANCVPIKTCLQREESRSSDFFQAVLVSSRTVRFLTMGIVMADNTV